MQANEMNTSNKFIKDAIAKNKIYQEETAEMRKERLEDE